MGPTKGLKMKRRKAKRITYCNRLQVEFQDIDRHPHYNVYNHFDEAIFDKFCKTSPFYALSLL